MKELKPNDKKVPKKRPSDINILETGLGGRLDATNIVENKKLTIITKIGFDHEEFLGNNIQKIVTCLDI